MDFSRTPRVNRESSKPTNYIGGRANTELVSQKHRTIQPKPTIIERPTTQHSNFGPPPSSSEIIDSPPASPPTIRKVSDYLNSMNSIPTNEPLAVTAAIHQSLEDRAVRPKAKTLSTPWFDVSDDEHDEYVHGEDRTDGVVKPSEVKNGNFSSVVKELTSIIQKKEQKPVPQPQRPEFEPKPKPVPPQPLVPLKKPVVNSAPTPSEMIKFARDTVYFQSSPITLSLHFQTNRDPVRLGLLKNLRNGKDIAVTAGDFGLTEDNVDPEFGDWKSFDLLPVYIDPGQLQDLLEVKAHIVIVDTLLADETPSTLSSASALDLSNIEVLRTFHTKDFKEHFPMFIRGLYIFGDKLSFNRTDMTMTIIGKPNPSFSNVQALLNSHSASHPPITVFFPDFNLKLVDGKYRTTVPVVFSPKLCSPSSIDPSSLKAMMDYHVIPELCQFQAAGMIYAGILTHYFPIGNIMFTMRLDREDLQF